MPKPKPPSEAEILKLCDAVRECDDTLGKTSDHEGSKDGPTWALWSNGRESFRNHCEAIISWHEHAIRVWKRLMRLNERR
jgi:hypothetical protein